MRSYLEEVDFETIKQRFDAFWDGEVLDRPLIYITAPKKRQKSMDFPVPGSMEERWTSIDYVLKKMELYFENTLFLGDAIPWYLPNIGPDSFTSFLGANLSFRSEETSWADPFLEDLSGYKPVFDKNNRWWRFMDRLLDAVCEVAEGNFLVGIPDMHYGGDSLVATVGAQRLIRHIFSDPDEVKRLIGVLKDICCVVFDHYYGKISHVQKGSITWIPTYSRGRYFALQDDFSGLVSPGMFEEFFAEEVERLSKYLDNSLYHLDGPLAIGNLGRLLEIDSLGGIQWVPGAGAKPMSEWTDLCAEVLDAGKCLQISCTPKEVELLLSKLKDGGLFLSTHCSSEREARSVLRIVERYHR